MKNEWGTELLEIPSRGFFTRQGQIRVKKNAKPRYEYASETNFSDFEFDLPSKIAKFEQFFERII
jgi:hypothetical protein